VALQIVIEHDADSFAEATDLAEHIRANKGLAPQLKCVGRFAYPGNRPPRNQRPKPGETK
jgi:hypothetical protein